MNEYVSKKHNFWFKLNMLAGFGCVALSLIMPPGSPRASFLLSAGLYGFAAYMNSLLLKSCNPKTNCGRHDEKDFKKVE